MFRDRYTVDGKTLKKNRKIINTYFRMVVTQKRMEEDLVRAWNLRASEVLVTFYLTGW